MSTLQVEDISEDNPESRQKLDALFEKNKSTQERLQILRMGKGKNPWHKGYHLPHQQKFMY